jgi:hypothetical protein
MISQKSLLYIRVLILRYFCGFTVTYLQILRCLRGFTRTYMPDLILRYFCGFTVTYLQILRCLHGFTRTYTPVLILRYFCGFTVTYLQILRCSHGFTRTYTPILILRSICNVYTYPHTTLFALACCKFFTVANTELLFSVAMSNIKICAFVLACYFVQ